MPDATTPVGAPTVAQIQRYLIDTQHQWLSTGPRVVLAFTRLAGVVHQLLTTHTAAVRAINTELVRELAVLDAELAEAHADVDRLHTQHAEVTG